MRDLVNHRQQAHALSVLSSSSQESVTSATAASQETPSATHTADAADRGVDTHSIATATPPRKRKAAVTDAEQETRADARQNKRAKPHAQMAPESDVIDLTQESDSD